MSNYSEQHINQLVIYRKSLYIFKLSREIASYITDGKDMLSMYCSKEKVDKYADRLIMNSLGLVPKIVEAESEENPQLKLKSVISLRYIIEVIQEDCKKLKAQKIKGLDFLILLQKELKAFRKIHKHYVKSLMR